MDRYSVWSEKNRAVNGNSSDKEIDFEMGAGRMARVSESKQEELIELRSKTNNRVLNTLEELLQVSQSEVEFFTRVEDSNIPLLTLVALNITTEENIQSYQTMRSRGIDTMSLQRRKLGKRIDREYMAEVESMVVDNPELLNISGDSIEHKVKNKIYAQKNIDVPVALPEIKPSQKSRNADLETTVVLDDDMMVEPLEESKEALEKAQAWLVTLNKIKNNTEEAIEDLGEDYVEEEVEPVRKVYILANEFKIEPAEGYEFIFIKEQSTIDTFASSRENILIVTEDIPPLVVEGFINWLGQVSSTGAKFRLATIKSMPIYHELIQGELLALNKTNLDNFYLEHDTASLIGKGVGSFFDISAEL